MGGDGPLGSPDWPLNEEAARLREAAEERQEQQRQEEAQTEFVVLGCLALFLGLACGLAGIAYAVSLVLQSSWVSSFLHG